jgi:two-component system NtrC family sensor kinase
LLSFSRKQALKPELVRLQTWLPSAEQLLRTTLGGRIQLELVVQPLTSAIRVDTGELELALINLAMNAKHAMPDGGTFAILASDVSLYTGAEQQPQVVISVSDTGGGIAPEILPRVA